MMKYQILCLSFLLFSEIGRSQNVKKEKMAQLSYMVGEWVGTSKLYENGEISKEVPAFESIAFDLDSTILVIQLKSETLNLHTIIYYDEAEQSYFYYPFSKNGVRKLPASFENGRLTVQSSSNRRYIFCSTEKGFREYGEKKMGGKWTLYFQDDFVNTK